MSIWGAWPRGKQTGQMYCGLCHTCGTRLMVVLDGEEWCPQCRCYRRYWSHGWSSANGDSDSARCPKGEEIDEKGNKDHS
jgi:hypothetical protein